MIHYRLTCSHSHDFDGWFRDSTAFDTQAEAGLLECPECGDARVSRALMAPAVPRKGRRAAPTEFPAERAPVPSPAEARPVAVGGQRMPDQVRAALQRLRSEVERNCDYVGPEFADEARRIHRGESDHRAIYGETTPDQAEALADEGIDIARIPWLPRSDA